MGLSDMKSGCFETSWTRPSEPVLFMILCDVIYPKGALLTCLTILAAAFGEFLIAWP